VGGSTDRVRGANDQKRPQLKGDGQMTRLRRLRRIGLAIVVGVLVTLPTAGSALAGLTATAAD
jgi:hypothetical protein